MPPAEPLPFAPDELKQIFASLVGTAGLLVAVSGGSDSVALLDLLIKWRGDEPCAPAISVATVDHRLRPQSRVEAQAVAQMCAAYSVRHRVLVWQGKKPKTGVPAAARQARYRLLGEEAKRLGFAQILTAHTLDDQGETVLMRLMRGSGLRGLGGMRALTDKAGMRIVRPLLAISRARLQAHLKHQKIVWHDDPTNEDTNYLRPRLRQIMALLATEGLTAERLSEVARKLQRADAAIEHMTLALMAQQEGDGRIARQIYCDAPEEVRLRCLAKWISNIGGECLPAADSALQRLDQALCEAKRTKLRQTLGFTIISAGTRYLRFSKEEARRRR